MLGPVNTNRIVTVEPKKNRDFYRGFLRLEPTFEPLVLVWH